MRKWFGDNYVGPAYFGFSWGSMSEENHLPQFMAVRDRLFQLAEAGDVSLIYCDDEGPVGFVVAYRFTSDRARYQWSHELLQLGGSLGRGVWDIFTSDPGAKWTYDRFFRDNEDHRKKAAGQPVRKRDDRPWQVIEAEEVARLEREEEADFTRPLPDDDLSNPVR